MGNRVLTLLMLFAVLSGNAGGEDVVIQFRLRTPGLPASAKVYLTGNLPSLGRWKPDGVAMKQEADDVWTHRLDAAPGTRVEFKYTLGSWEREAAADSGGPRKNSVIESAQSMVHEDSVSAWTDRKPRPKASVAGKVTGDVRYHRDVEANELRSRDVSVWLPPGYAESDRRCPVLYMQDGQNLFDPATSAFGVDWQIDETCTRLIQTGKIPPLIVVGIFNTPDRSREYLDDAGGEQYLRFLRDTVKPLIDRTYRTEPGRESCYIGGSSAGGYCAFRAVWEMPETFSKAICMSPAFTLKNEDGTVRLDKVTGLHASSRPTGRVFFYFDNGGKGLDARLQPGIDEAFGVLREKGLEPGRDYEWSRQAEHDHNESAWALRFPAAIERLLGPKTP